MDEYTEDPDPLDDDTPGKQKMSVVFVPTFDSTIGIYYRKRESYYHPLSFYDSRVSRALFITAVRFDFLLSLSLSRCLPALSLRVLSGQGWRYDSIIPPFFHISAAAAHHCMYTHVGVYVHAVTHGASCATAVVNISENYHNSLR